MKFIAQALDGAYLIEPEPYVDHRGLLRRHFCQRDFAAHGIDLDVRQCNISENPRAGTLRGLHYQRPPHAEGKLLSCIRGAIYDICADLRSESTTYLRWIAVELSAENRRSLWVPPGCANGWMTLLPETWIHYYHSEFYTPHAEYGIRYDDPSFKFSWPSAPILVSEKDRSFPNFTPEDSRGSRTE
jgi:dTDP-4-dehydrorhamnose 3,5-epimerase